MIAEWNTILYISGLLVLVVPAGHWLWKLWKSPIGRKLDLLWWYAAFVLSIFCTGLHILNVCVAEVYGWNVMMSLLKASVLFFFPVLNLLQKSICGVRPANSQTVALYMFPSVLFTSYVVFLRLLYGLDTVMGTPWMHQTEVVGYNFLLFLNTIVGVILVIRRSREYRFKASNYFPDRNMTDCAEVRDVAILTICIGALVYFFLLVSFRILQGNLPATAFFIVVLFLLLNILGHTLSKVKGVTVPADYDWTSKTLTLDQITYLEERSRQAKELMSAESATKNIGEIIEKWVNRSNPSYLRAGITLTEVAYEMRIPSNILSAYINKTLNTNFNQWINAYRLKHVKYLLLTTNNTLEEIAEATGFATRNLLSRNFKTHEGITPSEYRAKAKYNDR